MRCLHVTKQANGTIERCVSMRPISDLPAGDVLVRVHFSSLNYKDALAATGHPGVVSQFPHVPGIDAAGVVEESKSARFQAGDKVIVTSFELGAGRWGGYAEFIRVPADWVVPLPDGLTLQQSMILGTAGLTAALSVEAIQRQGIQPSAGMVAVTGASGGVGTLAVAILAQAGFRPAAITGKTNAETFLRTLGAAEVLARDAVSDDSGKPLLKPRWAAGIDVVGGTVLATLIRCLQPRGCVAACGLVGGAELPLSIYPFILRGATLSGIDSAWYPAERRAAIWQKLAGPWKPKLLDDLATEVTLENLEPQIQRILAGQIIGRVVVAMNDK